MSAELEQRLRNAIAAFGDAWVDEVGRHPFEILEPALPARLVEIEDLLGASLPVSVRIVLETFDGSYIPVSPERPDTVMSTSAISSYLAYARDVVPLVERELDPETGIQRWLGVAVDDPWGPLRHDDGNVDTCNLLAWFEQVTAENATYVWPAPLQITPSDAWASRRDLSEADVRDMPVGAAIAVHTAQAKRNRIQLQVFVQLEPGVWARGISRKRDSSPSLHAMCAEASEGIGRETRRARSQWVLGPAQIIPMLRDQLFVGTVVID